VKRNPLFDAKPDVVEQHPEGKVIIEIEFYKLVNGQYKAWPYVKEAGRETKEHYAVAGEFATMEAARTVAIETARKLIAQGFPYHS